MSAGRPSVSARRQRSGAPLVWLRELRAEPGQSLPAEDRKDGVSPQETRSLSGALGLGLLRRPSRSQAVEIPIHFVEHHTYIVVRRTWRTVS